MSLFNRLRIPLMILFGAFSEPLFLNPFTNVSERKSFSHLATNRQLISSIFNTLINWVRFQNTNKSDQICWKLPLTANLILESKVSVVDNQVLKLKSLTVWNRYEYEDLEQSANYILKQTKHRPSIGIICGSGLGNSTGISCSSVFFFCQS